nr:MerR family transcriptional regulator [Angustibacter aerolatus]
MAEDLGVTHRTVRYYEDVGLVSPERRGTVRVYRARDRIRLRLVLRGKRLGFPLDEIRTIVDMYDQTPGEAGHLRYLLDQVGERRAEPDPAAARRAVGAGRAWPTSSAAAARTSRRCSHPRPTTARAPARARVAAGQEQESR